MYELLAALAREKDYFAVIEHVQSAGSPTDVAAAYDAAHLDAYWKHKDLPMVITLTQAGIHFCFTHARLASDPQMAQALRSVAKGLAYNLASFTWPGWDEPGITPTPTDIALGFQSAKLNLRLALELQKPPERIRSAHWLLGAHCLAANNTDQALTEFQQALPPDPNDPDHTLFAGYIQLAQAHLNSTRLDQWKSFLRDLESHPDEPAKFAREQLATAYRVFNQP